MPGLHIAVTIYVFSIWRVRSEASVLRSRNRATRHLFAHLQKRRATCRSSRLRQRPRVRVGSSLTNKRSPLASSRAPAFVTSIRIPSATSASIACAGIRRRRQTCASVSAARQASMASATAARSQRQVPILVVCRCANGRPSADRRSAFLSIEKLLRGGRWRSGSHPWRLTCP